MKYISCTSSEKPSRFCSRLLTRAKAANFFMFIPPRASRTSEPYSRSFQEHFPVSRVHYTWAGSWKTLIVCSISSEVTHSGAPAGTRLRTAWQWGIEDGSGFGRRITQAPTRTKQVQSLRWGADPSSPKQQASRKGSPYRRIRWPVATEKRRP